MATYAGMQYAQGIPELIVEAILTDPSDTQIFKQFVFVRDVTGLAPQPVVGQYYNQITEVFSARPVRPEELWYSRVTDDERGKIFALSQQDGGGVTLDVIQRGRLQAFLAFSTANVTLLDNAEMAFIFDALEAKGVIAAGRADEILER